MPSQVPEACLEGYSVNLDDTTEVHHITRRKVSLRTTLLLTKSSNPDFSSHLVEFSNGEMTAVARAKPAAVSPGQRSQIVRDGVADNLPGVARSSMPTSHGVISDGADSTPAGSDSSITEFGCIVGQQAANDRSSISTFCQSIIHLVPRNAMASTSIRAEGCGGAAQAQQFVEPTVNLEAPENSSTSRRSSTGSQCDETSASTAPTSPASSTCSTMPFLRSALANLPEVPFAPGKPNYIIKALALEEPKRDHSDVTDDQAVIRRLSWSLRISDRQLAHWDRIQDGESLRLEEISAPKTGLAMTDAGQIVAAEDASNIVQPSLISPQLVPEPFEAFTSSNLNTNISTRGGEALDVSSLEIVGLSNMASHDLDRTPGSKGEQPAQPCMFKNGHASEVFEETGKSASANQSSEELDIAAKAGDTQDSPSYPGSPDIGKMIEDLFGDEHDGFNTTAPVVNVPRAPTVINTPPVTPVKFRLGSSVLVDTVNETNSEFFRLWNGGVPGRCWIPGQDEDEVQTLAAVNVARKFGGLPEDIAFIAKDFNRIVAELWEQGHPQRPLVRGSQDDCLIHELAARNLEWRYLSFSLKSNAYRSATSEPTVRPRKTLEAAPSPFEWYLQALGGDDQYREHRSVKVAG